MISFMPLVEKNMESTAAVSTSGNVPLPRAIRSKSLSSDTDQPLLKPPANQPPLATSVSAGTLPVPAALAHDDTKKRQRTARQQPVIRTPSQKQVALFSHLPQYERETSLSMALNLKIKDPIHPSIIRLGLLYADYKVMGSSLRCREMLLAFKDVIRDYQMSPDHVISRHLETHLRPLIAFLVQARPLAVSMGHAIRNLKLRISLLPPEISEAEAKSELYRHIDSYIQNRLELANRLIVEHGLGKIYDGDVVLTFGHSLVVRDLLIGAHKAGRQFRVIIVGARPFLEGRQLLDELVEAGMDNCLYVQMSAVGYIMKDVTKTVIGAHCIFSNGSLLGRVGTAMVCHLSRRANVPVLACCESIKFSERVQLDSIVFNEIGDPDLLVHQPLRPGNPEPLAGWRDMHSLKLLNILYDLTPPELVSIVVSEIGVIPVTSIPVVLREYSPAPLQ